MLWPDRTEALARMFGRARVDMAKPLPAGSELRLYAGRATGHGELPAGTPIGSGIIDVGGMTPARIEFHYDGYLCHSVRCDDVVRPCYWDAVAGGWAEITIKTQQC